MLDDPEIFESLESFKWSETYPLTDDNLKTIHSRQGEELERLYAKYCFGGASPRNTYLHFAQKVADVDYGYASYCNE